MGAGAKSGGGGGFGRRRAEDEGDAELTLDEAAAAAPEFRRAAGDWCWNKWDCAANEECNRRNGAFGGRCEAGRPDGSNTQPMKNPKCSGSTYGPCTGDQFCEYQSRSGSYKCVW